MLANIADERRRGASPSSAPEERAWSSQAVPRACPSRAERLARLPTYNCLLSFGWVVSSATESRRDAAGRLGPGDNSGRHFPRERRGWRRARAVGSALSAAGAPEHTPGMRTLGAPQVLASLAAAFLLVACSRSGGGPAAEPRDMASSAHEMGDGSAAELGVCTLESAFTDCARQCWRSDAAFPTTGSPDWPCRSDPSCTDKGWDFICK